ncbi:MAG: CPBP family intramembrane metalloprotease [Agathobacter sp.]|nr:CPBP family intramembrane metalloprotease [Agathobacter sp.]
MKKFRTLLLSTTPFFLAFAMQFVAVYYLLFIAAIFLFVIAPIVQGTTYNETDLFILTADMNFNTIASILFSVFCSALFAIWYYRSCGGDLKINVMKRFHLLEVLGIVLLVPGAQFMSSIVTSIVSTIFPNWLEDYMELMETAGLSGEIPVLMMIYSVLLAPISEEFIFRGVTLRLARRAFPFWIANIIQALLFGIFHMNPLQGCYTFVIGLFLGYICEKGGTLYHAILFHLLFNLWGTTMSEFLVVEDVVLQGLIIIGGTILGTFGGIFFLQKGGQCKAKLS